MAPTIAAMMDKIESIFCQPDVLTCSRPLCRSQRSAMKTRSNVTTATVPMAMKTGLKLVAPTSEMYLHSSTSTPQDLGEFITHAMLCPSLNEL